VNEAEGTLAGDFGLDLIEHDVDGHVANAFAAEKVGKSDSL